MYKTKLKKIRQKSGWRRPECVCVCVCAMGGCVAGPRVRRALGSMGRSGRMSGIWIEPGSSSAAAAAGGRAGGRTDERAVAARPAKASHLHSPWRPPMAEGHVNGGAQRAQLEAHRPSSRKAKSVSFHSATSLPTERKISSGQYLGLIFLPSK
ncbi:Hypothetical predicted protein, partial [Cloeon dipterum]